MKPSRLFAAFVLGALAVGTPGVANAETPGPVMSVSSQQCPASARVTQRVPALDLMQSDLAWGVTRGAGVTVAVVDSGVNAANPHLVDAVVGGANLVPDGTDAGGRSDTYGHGTAIAGQIAARVIEGSEVQGLAPEATILPVRVFAGVDDREVEAGFGPSTPRIADGIRYAADQGAQIINVSMSTTENDAALADAVAYATARGSLVVASAGNRDATQTVEIDAADESDGPRYPAALPGVLGVAAADLNAVVTDASIHGSHVAVSALGQSIVTTSAAGGDCIYASEVPATSYAAGYVSAAAALVAAAHPDETPAQWAYRLEASAVRSDPDNADTRAGWGIVQPYDAIVLVPGAGVRGPESPFDVSGEAIVVPEAETIEVVTREPAEAQATAIAIVVGFVGLILLGGIGTLGVLVARRAADRRPTPLRSGRGLYGDE